MIAATVVFIYLAVVLYVGIFAFRRGANKAEDFFVANRSLGTFVFLLSLFGSNMTAFAILGSSGLAFRQGIGVFGLMASISGIIIPLSIFLIGTRIWALGKRHGYMTQVQMFRDRWEMGHIGTVIFVLQALMLVPYIIIGVMGGGETLEGVSGGKVPYAIGGLIVALVVMSYVFFGGMRGTAWVNTLQTLMFLVFGTIAFIIIARGMGGFGATVQKMAATLNPPAATAPATTRPTTAAAVRPPPPDGELLTRKRITKGYYASYALIPLSSIMFPHIAIFCLTAKKMSSFRKTVILYPLCIMAIWLPAVFLGAVAPSQYAVTARMGAGAPEVHDWLEAKAGLGKDGKPTAPQLTKILTDSKDKQATALLEQVKSGTVDEDKLGESLAAIRDPLLVREMRRLSATNTDGTMLALLAAYSPALLAGLLGAAIMACVMASDSQILALSTMWAEDVFRFYGGMKAYGETAQIWSARVFVVAMTIIAYIVAIAVHQAANIFEIAIQYAFSGYASMAPIMLACLFWKRSTKWGALASTLWVFTCLIGVSIIQYYTDVPTVPGTANVIWQIGDTPIVLREAVRVSFTEYRLLAVVPTFVGSALLMWIVSLLTTPPSSKTLAMFFGEESREPVLAPMK